MLSAVPTKVWLAGADGMLGHALAAALRAAGVEFSATDRELDITNAEAVVAFARRERPGLVVNAAAYTRVDDAETHAEQSFAVNERGAACLAQAASDVSAAFLHFSTDYVFDGDSRVPYTEDMPCAPRGVYAKSKRAGEVAVLETAAKNPAGVFVVRTSWLFGEHGKNFVTTILRLLEEREIVRVVDDQHGRPTYTRDLAVAALSLAGVLESPRAAPGIYHFANAGGTTWHAFARAIHDLTASAGVVLAARDIVPIPSSAYPLPAPRPHFSVLDTTRIATALGREPRSWRDALAEFLTVVRESGA
jgi:dTDP-4-dehydrorhamnose reductase